MSILPIVKIPDPILRIVSKPVERIDGELRVFLDAMLETTTSCSHNLLTSRSGYEASNEASYTFEAISGSAVEIHIAGGVFQEDRSNVDGADGLSKITEDTQ